MSATVVALALVADNTDLGFRFALLLIPLLIVIGLATVVRLVQLNSEDVELVVAMNRLRRGYLDLAPELEHYFTTGHSEDVAGIMQTYGGRRTRIPATQYLSSIAMLVSVIVAVLIGALASLVIDAFDAAIEVAVVIGIVAGLAAMATLVVVVVRHVNSSLGPAPARRVVGVSNLQPALPPAAPGSVRTSRGRTRPAAPPRPWCPRARNTSSGAAIASFLGQP